MIKYHEIIRPSIPDCFFQQAVDMWLGFDSGHMGAQLYQHHDGMRGDQPMSGVVTWEQHAKHGSFPKINSNAFDNGIERVLDKRCQGLPIIEFGPGSMDDAAKLVKILGTKEYTPVDLSLGIIQQSKNLVSGIADCTVRPAILDFFAPNNPSLTDERSLGVLLGVTISNLPGPVPAAAPASALTSAFKNITKTMQGGGYFLISMDSCQDGERNKELYSEPWHKLFGVNHIYRMNEELPMHNFDPNGFEYNPVWQEHCGLLAHTVCAVKDQVFEMGVDREIVVSVKKGDVFHYNNSFKYKNEFFEMCANAAGLSLLNKVKDDSSITFYLFEVPARN